MKAVIEEQFPKADISLIEGGGGDFEVKLDGSLIFSKRELNRFPEEEEVLGALQQ